MSMTPEQVNGSSQSDPSRSIICFRHFWSKPLGCPFEGFGAALCEGEPVEELGEFFLLSVPKAIPLLIGFNYAWTW